MRQVRFTMLWTWDATRGPSPTSYWNKPTALHPLFLRGRKPFKNIALGNVMSLSGYSYCHGLFKTYSKMSYTQFKQEFELRVRQVTIVDIERMRNLRQSIRFVTKQDPHAVVIGFDMGLTSWIVKAHCYAQTHSRLNWGDPIPASISTTDRKSFEGMLPPKDYVYRKRNSGTNCQMLPNMIGRTRWLMMSKPKWEMTGQ
jgi:hypothetical protein